jgi:oligopeptide/dipeptide ABC transporter ATP-binding protein
MKNGAIVEAGETRRVLDQPQHPYTQQLLEAYPLLRPRGSGGYSLSGEPRHQDMSSTN